MCTPVCAALGYLPQAEFDEAVARKDAQVYAFISMIVFYVFSSLSLSLSLTIAMRALLSAGGREKTLAYEKTISMCRDKKKRRETQIAMIFVCVLVVSSSSSTFV